jgi:hypothetical protein
MAASGMFGVGVVGWFVGLVVVWEMTRFGVDRLCCIKAIAEPVECRIACIRRVIERLPPGNRCVIKRVTAMFKVIQNFSEQNKMTAKNISIVMGPTMFRYVYLLTTTHTHTRTLSLSLSRSLLT